MSFFAELKRRNVWRMAVLYAVTAWLIMQVAEVTIGLGALPESVGRAVLAILAIGFPIALIFAWVYEITPEGVKLEKDVDPADSVTHITGRRMDFIAISILAAAVMLFAYDKWWIAGPPSKSIAVLAFENMTGDPDQEYFSDGFSEEVLNLLAQVPELRVISRTSSFAFKGKDIPIPSLAEQLNVAHVLEGSVRKDGNRVRITAQLIEAISDTHLWTKTYEMTVDDIFTIQNEIAAAITDQLQLALPHLRRMTVAPNAEAYDQYLLGRYLSDQVQDAALVKAQSAFQAAIELDPDFSDAWVGLGGIYRFRADRGHINREAGIELARNAVEMALQLDPHNANAYALLGRIKTAHDWDWRGAQDALKKAAEIDPKNASTLRQLSHLLSTLGQLDEAIELGVEATSLDPLNLTGLQNLAVSYLWAGMFDLAESTLSQVLNRDNDHPTAWALRAMNEVLRKNPGLALGYAQNESYTPLRLFAISLASWANEDLEQANDHLTQLVKDYGDTWFYQIAEVYAFMGQKEEAFQWLEKAYTNRDSGIQDLMVDPFLNSLHDDSRWKDLVEKLGFLPV